MNTKAKLTPEMEANKWRKGDPSPNPSGRPKKAPLSEAYAYQVGELLPDEVRSRLKLRRGATWANAIAVKQIHAALRGSTGAAKEIADRIEGRVTQPIAGEDGGPVAVRWIVEHIGGPKEPKA